MCKYCDNLEATYFEGANDGELRVWHIPQAPMGAFHYPVASVQEAILLLNCLAQYDLFQFEHDVKPDYSNAQGLEVFEDGEWIEYYDEDGNDIIEFINNA